MKSQNKQKQRSKLRIPVLDKHFEVSTNLQLNIGKNYLKTAIIIDESLILAIVSRNYSTKPSYIFQLKRELLVWKYIFNLFHFEYKNVLILRALFLIRKLLNLKIHFSFRFLTCI
jgi:hypothetical protein